jgi:hypothetical protein
MRMQNGKKQNSTIGSSFDSFLEEEGILDEVHSEAQARVRAWQSSQESGGEPGTDAVARNLPD